MNALKLKLVLVSIHTNQYRTFENLKHNRENIVDYEIGLNLIITKYLVIFHCYETYEKSNANILPKTKEKQTLLSGGYKINRVVWPLELVNT